MLESGAANTLLSQINANSGVVSEECVTSLSSSLKSVEVADVSEISQ